MFIVVHQVQELWFKVILRELTLARNIVMDEGVTNDELASAVRALRRATVVYQQAAHQFSVMETLTPRDFLMFRDNLNTASGLQSAQMREIEILFGLCETSRPPDGAGWHSALKNPDGTPSKSYERVQDRFDDLPTFRTALYDWLARLPIDGSRSQIAVDDFLNQYIECHRLAVERRVLTAALPMTSSEYDRIRERRTNDHLLAKAFLMATDDPAADEDTRKYRRRVRAGAVFVESYRELPRLAWARELVDSAIEFEQAMLTWRDRHVRMVERVIGRRTGSGGSPGVDYLDQTTKYRILGDLWVTRTLLLAPQMLPMLRFAEE
jgi:tryptophan 2,3-dioxygenase